MQSYVGQYDTTTPTVHGAVRINLEKIRQDPFQLSCLTHYL